MALLNLKAILLGVHTLPLSDFIEEVLGLARRNGRNNLGGLKIVLGW